MSSNLDYVDKIIEYYLKEKPIIKSLPTKSFAKISKDGAEVLDEDAIIKVLKNQKDLQLSISFH